MSAILIAVLLAGIVEDPKPPAEDAVTITLQIAAEKYRRRLSAMLAPTADSSMCASRPRTASSPS